jgi:nitrite reductase (NADH) small subunit
VIADEEISMEMRVESEWLGVCGLGEIPRQGSRVVELDGIRVALFRTADDQVHALEDRCPHKGGPLSQGIVFDQRVACPLHGWQIRLDTGHACSPDEGCVRRYRIKVENDEVFVATDE